MAVGDRRGSKKRGTSATCTSFGSKGKTDCVIDLLKVFTSQVHHKQWSKSLAAYVQLSFQIDTNYKFWYFTSVSYAVPQFRLGQWSPYHLISLIREKAGILTENNNNNTCTHQNTPPLHRSLGRGSGRVSAGFCPPRSERASPWGRAGGTGFPRRRRACWGPSMPCEEWTCWNTPGRTPPWSPLWALLRSRLGPGRWEWMSKSLDYLTSMESNWSVSRTRGFWNLHREVRYMHTFSFGSKRLETEKNKHHNVYGRSCVEELNN